MSKPADNSDSEVGPRVPLPHFYEETLAYLRGDLDVLDKLPAAQANALRMAKRSKTRAVLVDQSKHSTPRPQTVAIVHLGDQMLEAYQQKLDIQNTAYCHTMASSTPAVPPLGQISLVVVQGPPRSVTADEQLQKGPLRVNNTAVKDETIQPVFDGLRSSPPRCLTGGHMLKPYTDSFSDTTPSNEKSDLSKADGSEDANFPPGSPNLLETPPSTPRLELAILAIRAVPKVITTHRPRQQFPSSPPPPSLNHKPTPTPKKREPSPPNFSKPLPLYPHPYHDPQPQHPAQQKYPHYTSPQATLLLSTLRSYLLLPRTSVTPTTSTRTTTDTSSDASTSTTTSTSTTSTTDTSTAATAEVLAGLLLKWPTLRHNLPRRNPALAAQINRLDWRGVEAGLPEGSFVRKLVEGWIYCGGGGMGLFGEWEWPWE